MRHPMKLVIFVTLAVVVFLSPSRASGPRSVPTDCAWIQTALKEIRSVKVGMTRSQLETIFTPEGGMSTRRLRRYTYRSCQFIKVEVRFQAIQHPNDKEKEFPDDKIIEISKPYIQNQIID